MKKFNKTSSYAFALSGLLLGMSIGPFMTWHIPLALGMACLAVLAIYVRWWKKKESPRLQKGIQAENETGQLIEFGIVTRECAAAHNIMDIPNAREIDHIVMTPERIWVVETKWRPVRKKDFPRVLNTIATNVKAVREWAATPGTEVQGCLVLARDRDRIRSLHYDEDSERILLEDPRSLAEKLRGEVGKSDLLRSNSELKNRIWKLGIIEYP